MENLSRWVVCQRNLHLIGKLEHVYIRRLDEVGFVWDRKDYLCRKKDSLWDKMFSGLRQRLDSVGASGLESALKDDVELSKWVRGQQSAKRRGMLSSQQQSALDKIGFPWQFPKIPKDSTKPSWESLFVKLVEFQKMHGHCDVKLVLPFDEHLHKWAQVQRQSRENGMLTEAQVRQLDQIGFVWQTDDLLWERMLKTLITYKSAHGDCNVPLNSQLDSQLAIWVTRQRKQRAKGSLRKERVERLESLGFEW